MNHLFVINPAAYKLKTGVNTIINEISNFFSNHPELQYDIYVSEWCRDAVTYIRQYIMNKQSKGIKTTRVHAVGGTGTLFEVINGIMGFSDVQIAAYSYGRVNSFIQYFGQRNKSLFVSLENQIFDDTISIDAVRCGNNYGLCFGLTGIEAYSNVLGDKFIEKGFPTDLSYIGAAVYQAMTDKTVAQNYHIDIDGVSHNGKYLTVMIANTPSYGNKMSPAVDAHPDDGNLEVYLFKNTSKFKMLTSVYQYVMGNYHKFPDLISHYSAKKVSISSDETICVCIDGEYFYGLSIEYEIIPKAIDFVLPKGIDLKKIPRIYNKPKEGFRDA